MFKMKLQSNCDAEVIELDDVSPEVMSAIMRYLYYHDIKSVPGIAHEPEACKSFQHKLGRCIEGLPTIVDIYIAADKYDFPGLRDKCVTHIFRMLIPDSDNNCLGLWSAAIWTAYGKALTNLPATSKLHRLLLSWLCCDIQENRNLTDDVLNSIRTLLPEIVLIEILRTLGSGSGSSVAMELEDNGELEYWLEEEEEEEEG